MSGYFTSIYAAFVIFILVGLVLMIPWLLYSYWKYGYLSVWASFVTYSFVFYMLAALFLVLFPLPATSDTCSLQSSDAVQYTLDPFSLIRDVMNNSSVVWSQPSTYGRLLTQPVSLHALFNFLLLRSFGVYLRYFFSQRSYWKRAF